MSFLDLIFFLWASVTKGFCNLQLGVLLDWSFFSFVLMVARFLIKNKIDNRENP